MKTLTSEQLKALGVFLGRVDLKGVEVNVFNDIVNTLFRKEELSPEAKPEDKLEPEENPKAESEVEK